MPDFSAAVALLKMSLDALHLLANDPLKEKIATLKALPKVKNLHKRLWESQRVKTIWHTEKPLSLSSFFYPVSVRASATGRGNSTKINSLDDLPQQHTIISGTVGQGKSIFLRFLLGQELKSGNHIPLLCELRNVESQSLAEYLSFRFAMLLGIVPDDKLFTFFASNGKIAFLLDGFDEISPENAPRITQELEDLATRFSTCRIALTSRPDSECRHLTSFHTVSIAPLSTIDLQPFYRKIGHDVDFAQRLVNAITRSPTRIRELIVTPLLATLLAISYRAAQKIPLEFSEFYEELFQILLSRHDTSKLGWKRIRKTKLSDRDFQQIFEAFCFSTRKRHLTTLSADDATQVAKDCLTSLKLDGDPQHVIDDIRRVTCLLVQEGNKFQFVHKSVQEFFAARFVKTRTEPVAASFYTQILPRGKWTAWQEELIFLKQIDTHRATKYFFLPDLKATLEHLLKDASTVSNAIAASYLEGMSVMKMIVARDGLPVTTYVIQRIRPDHTYHLQIIDSRVFGQLFSNNSRWSRGFLADTTSMQRTYLQIAKDIGDAELASLLVLVQSAIAAQQTEFRENSQWISDQEVTTGLIDLTGI